jgi:hypothetical protein
MKSIVYLVFFTLSVCGFAYGEDNVVTAEKLSISDVEAYAKKIEGKYPQFEVLGIHQEGNTAVVYFTSIRNPDFGPHVDEFKIVRFNSGKWFDPEEKELVTVK